MKQQIEHAYTNPVTSTTSFIKPNQGFVSTLGCVPHDYSQRHCSLCGQWYYGTHACNRGWNLNDYIPELGRKLSDQPCGERHKDGPITCTLPHGHDGKHSAPVRWDHW